MRTRTSDANWWLIVASMLFLSAIAAFGVIRVQADLTICREYFPKVPLYACMVSDKTRVLP